MKKLYMVLLMCAGIACNNISSKRIEGNGVSAMQEREVGDFAGVSGMGHMEIIVNNGPSHTIKIEGDQNLLEYIETRNNGDVVEVHTKDGYNLRSKKPIRIYATAPAFSSLKVAGSGDIRSEGKIISNELYTEVSGSGNISLEVDAPRIKTEIAGSGAVTLHGTTRDFLAQVSGSGEIRAFRLLSENTEVDIAGSGDVEVYASKSLDIDIAGAGDVRYKGNPGVKQNIAGSGNISRVE
jgi:hypothetical protein